MEIKEIIDSGIFRAIISSYVEYYESYNNEDRDRLIYTLCDSDEEKDIATLVEIAKIKKKIIKYGYEYLSMDFFNRYNDTDAVDYTRGENNSGYWENYFHEYFISELEDKEIGSSLTPFTDAQCKIDKVPKNPTLKELENIDEETRKAIFWKLDKKNFQFVIESEEKIMDQIELDIEKYKEEGEDYWDIELFFYESYIEQSEILKLLFKLSKLLVLLYRLKMFKSFLGLETEEYTRNPLNDKLEQYGFFNLPMIKRIPIEKHASLIVKIASSKIPYIIAFFDYVGFLKHLEKEFFQTKYKLNLELAKLLNTHPRAIKGNISSLLPTSTEDKKRYTAYCHKEMVENEYQRLK